MNRRTTLAMLLASIAGVWGLANAQGAPQSTAVRHQLTAGRGLVARQIRLVTAPEGNEARYRVNEQLVGIDLPSDAVGATKAVTGVLVLEDNGTIVSAESKFTIDLTTLKSDQEMRDNYIRRNTLQTEQHPTAVFVPTAFKGLTFPVPSSGELKFQLVGDLTVHGQTKSVTWDVTGRAQGGAYSGAATTVFTFADFGMTIPRVRRVLSVKDEIKLEYDFRLVPEPAGEF
jgi:polyisoprenoid-binding protein YceI